MTRRGGIWTVGGGVAALLTAGCGAEGQRQENRPGSDLDAPTAEVQLESQCGDSLDFQHVEQYDGLLGVSSTWVQRHEGAVGSPVAGCSGTLISDDLFLSAGHCGYEEGDVVRFNFQHDPSGNPRTPSEYTVTDVVEQEDNASYDYAIVRLSGNPGRTWGYARLADRDEEGGDHVVILGHPSGDPKKLHAGPVVAEPARQGPNWFRHQVDTLSGSSGSGVLTTDGYLIGVHTDGDCDPGNSAMKITKLIDHSFELQKVFYGEQRAHGWVWANEAGSASYTPSLPYQFSTGAASTVTRSGTGAYTVRFTSLGTGIIPHRGGNVQVTAYGTGAYCKLASWNVSSSHVDVDVRCFGTSGSAKDSRFVAFYDRNTFEGFADEHGTAGYVWSQSTSYASSTNASSDRSANDSGGTNTITQNGTGDYTVLFPGVDDADAAVHVTAYGSDNA